jgi:alpha-L-rhamnosidase
MGSAARWIWIPLREYVNQHVYFRKTFDLASAAQLARIRISADTRYRLYVNGESVQRGPARGFPESQPCDEIDLGPHLKCGPNVIAVHVMSFGVSTAQNISRDRAGLFVEGEVKTAEQTVDLDSNHTWRLSQALAYRRHVGRCGSELGFQEHFDATREAAGKDIDWTGVGFDDSGWLRAHVLGAAGVLPWHAMESRGVPLLKIEPVSPVAIVGQWEGRDLLPDAAPEEISNIARLVASEKRVRAAKNLFERTATLLKTGESAAAKLTAQNSGKLAALVVDFGEVRYGHPMLQIKGAKGGEIFDLVYDERVDESGIQPETLTQCGPFTTEYALADRVICRAGTTVFESLQPRGFRYVMLVARNVRHALTIEKLALNEIHYPTTLRGSFECSDERLNKIWHVGARTLQHCMADTLMNSPRSQEMGWASARIAALTNYYTFGDSALVKRGLRLMAQSSMHVPEGVLLGVAPSERADCVLPDFALHWVASLSEYYQFTGDAAALKEFRPTLEKVLGFFSILAGERGLLGPAPNYSLFLDWAPGLDRGNLSATFNLLYLHALRHSIQIGMALGDSGLTSHCKRNSISLAERIVMVFSSMHRNLMVEGIDMRTGEPADIASQHSIALAVLEKILGKRDEDRTGAVANVLSDFLPPEGPEIAPGPVRANLFFRAFVHEALAKLGRPELALEDIRRTWGYMLDQGATTWWERLPMKPGASACHAWSTHPTAFLSREVLGLSPIQAGWKRFRVAPQTLGLSSAKGKVPTPHGDIEISWKAKAGNQDVELVVPENTEAEVCAPDGKPPRTLGPGTYRWSE